MKILLIAILLVVVLSILVKVRETRSIFSVSKTVSGNMITIDNNFDGGNEDNELFEGEQNGDD